MVAWCTLIGGLLLYTALAIALFRYLLLATADLRISALAAIAVYWFGLAASLLPIWWGAIKFADYLYSSYPSLRVAAWDIGLVWIFVIGKWLSVTIGFISAILFVWKALLHAKGRINGVRLH